MKKFSLSHAWDTYGIVVVALLSLGLMTVLGPLMWGSVIGKAVTAGVVIMALAVLFCLHCDFVAAVKTRQRETELMFLRQRFHHDTAERRITLYDNSPTKRFNRPD